MELVEKMLGGAQQPLARLITLVERESAEVTEIMKAINPYVGRAFCVGLTGPPGGGKSTMADKLTAVARKKGLTVGIIAVDPTSPFSGGAVLGDRIRMQQHYLDEGVFIRSMATRGSHGGLPRTTLSVIKLLDAFGKDIIFVETVGVGQTELDVMEAVDTIVVVLVPEAGDTIQTMKAGLLEIANIFAVNKADREGADYLVAELEAMLRQSPKQSWWQVPALATQAVNDVGIEELFEHIEQHRRALQETGRLASRRQQQRRAEFFQAVENRLMSKIAELVEHDRQLVSCLQRVEAGDLDPYTASREILGNKAILDNWLKRLEEE